MKEFMAEEAVTDEAEWFFDDGTRTRGPFTLRAIGEMARAGVVGLDVPVARDGANGWRPFSEVVGGEAVPAATSPQEPAPVGDTFRVHLGGLRAPYSKMGFVWGGRLQIAADGALVVSARRQLGPGLRFLGGLLGFVILVPLMIWVIDVGAGAIAGLINAAVPVAPETVSTAGEHRAAGMAALGAAALHFLAAVVSGAAVGLMLMSSVLIPIFISSRCVARRGTGRFTIADGAVVSRKGMTVTMPLIEGGGRPIRAARITFESEDEAARFVETVAGGSGEQEQISEGAS